MYFFFYSNCTIAQLINDISFTRRIDDVWKYRDPKWMKKSIESEKYLNMTLFKKNTYACLLKFEKY